MKPWLPSIISLEQSAFVGGRQIQDNIFIVQEVLHQLRVRKRRRKFQAVLKLDMKKAYDRVEWDFLCDCMKKMGFNEKWVNMVKFCISSAHFRVLINGHPGDSFTPTRGIRQGDPLSPYLFIIMANALSHMVTKAIMDGTLKGIKLNPHCPILSHLFFADDAIFFLDGTLMEAQNLSNILNCYCFASGQSINLNKSGVFLGASCPQHLKNNIAAELRVPILEKTGKYLGIPSDWGQMKKQMLDWIIARVDRKLEGWKEQLISKAGKEVLIKMVVQALPQYAMNIFKIPLSICRSIERKISAFWWRQNAQQKGIHWKSWEVLKKRKAQGGMGFKDLVEFNKAMLGKQAWRLEKTPEALWSRIFKGLYFPNGNLWTATRGARPSWGWQSLLIGRDALKPDLKWEVGDGKSINLRDDRWLMSGSIGGPANRDNPKLVAEIIDPTTRTWKYHKITEIFDSQISEEIQATTLSIFARPDRLIWTGHNSGEYKTKNGYYKLQAANTSKIECHASSSYQVPQQLWTEIWHLQTTPRIRHFMWSLCNEGLPTRANLYRRKIIPEPTCPLCSQFPETSEHLFGLCLWTRKIWQHHYTDMNVSPTSITRTDRWVSEYLRSGITESQKAIFATTLWLIWKARNAWIFNGKRKTQEQIVNEALLSHQLYEKWNPREKLKRSYPRTWQPPATGSLKINVDCSWLAEKSEGSIAGICRGEAGVCIGGFAQKFRAQSAQEGETLAVQQALLWLRRQRTALTGLQTAARTQLIFSSPVCISSDCTYVVEAILGQTEVAWASRPNVLDCRELLAQMRNVTLRYEARETNRAADWLAKSHNTGSLPSNWVSHPPLELYLILCMDFQLSCNSESPN